MPSATRRSPELSTPPSYNYLDVHDVGDTDFAAAIDAAQKAVAEQSKARPDNSWSSATSEASNGITERTFPRV